MRMVGASPQRLSANRKWYAGNWTLRAAAATAGIYGNDPAEALYPMLAADSDGQKPDCAANRYTLTFPPDGLPPVNAFWSVMMYRARQRTAEPLGDAPFAGLPFVVKDNATIAGVRLTRGSRAQRDNGALFHGGEMRRGIEKTAYRASDGVLVRSLADHRRERSPPWRVHGDTWPWP
jgi:hypothetical protein